MSRDYSIKKPLSKADQDAARKRAKTNLRTRFAVSVVCHDEAGRQAMFCRLIRVAGDKAGDKKLKMVVS